MASSRLLLFVFCLNVNKNKSVNYKTIGKLKLSVTFKIFDFQNFMIFFSLEVLSPELKRNSYH